jgi:hypothetical protein
MRMLTANHYVNDLSEFAPRSLFMPNSSSRDKPEALIIPMSFLRPFILTVPVCNNCRKTPRSSDEPLSLGRLAPPAM